MKALVIHAGSNWERDIIERLYQLAKENTRPQPAPPEGEPDFEKLRTDAITAWRKCSKDDPFWGRREVFLVRYSYRLGVAARPKVEDAEVTKIANDLREAGKVLDNGVTKILDAGFFVKAADLLERLSGERNIWRDNFNCATAEVMRQRRERAAAEAELAAVESFLILGWTLDDAIEEHPDDSIGEIAKRVKEHHATRQQQRASAEQAAREKE